MLVPEWDGVKNVDVLGFGCEECRVSRGARKAVEVLPESEVDEIRGKLEVEEEAARPVAVPCPPSLTLEGLELVPAVVAVSIRVSVSSLSSPSRSLSRFEPDLDIEGMSG